MNIDVQQDEHQMSKHLISSTTNSKNKHFHSKYNILSVRGKLRDKICLRKAATAEDYLKTCFIFSTEEVEKKIMTESGPYILSNFLFLIFWNTKKHCPILTQGKVSQQFSYSALNR
jgi:hypothetical protein